MKIIIIFLISFLEIGSRIGPSFTLRQSGCCGCWKLATASQTAVTAEKAKWINTIPDTISSCLVFCCSVYGADSRDWSWQLAAMERISDVSACCRGNGTSTLSKFQSQPEAGKTLHSSQTISHNAVTLSTNYKAYKPPSEINYFLPCGILAKPSMYRKPNYHDL